MTEKRFKHSEIIQDDGQTICYGIEDTQTRHIFNVVGDGIYDVSEKELIKLLNKLNDENEQLKQQLQIFEKFLEENDLSIDWVEFCGLDECAFENPDFSCKDCIHLKGDDGNA